MNRLPPMLAILFALVGGALGCREAPPVRVSEKDLLGSYIAQSKEIGSKRTGTILLKADGKYIHSYEVRGEHREQVGTWTVLQSASGSQVQLTDFVTDWLSSNPVLWQTSVQRYGERLALVADSDIGFYFVKTSE